MPRDGKHRRPIPTTKSSRRFLEQCGQEAASPWSFALRLRAMRVMLKGDHASVSHAVLRGICRHHDDQMLRLASLPAKTAGELAEKVRLLEGQAPAMAENALLPTMVSAALVENALYLAIPDAPSSIRPRRK